MRVGIEVICTTCGQPKKPLGRSGPLGVPYCEPKYYGEHDGCDGYWQEPKVGSLWPGETSEEFGYPVGSEGTREV
jgi:hypothetical protein